MGQEILDSKSSHIPASQAGRMVTGGLFPETGLSQLCLRRDGASDVGTQPTILSTQLRSPGREAQLWDAAAELFFS